MKRRFTLSIAYVPGRILVSLTKVGSGTLVQQRGISAASMGTVLLPYQSVSVALAGDFNSDGDMDALDLLVFKRVGYIEADNIYKFAAHNSPARIALAQGETVSLELVATTYGRGTVFSKSRDALVTSSAQVSSVYHTITWCSQNPDMRAEVQLIEKTPGQIVGILIALLLP